MDTVKQMLMSAQFLGIVRHVIGALTPVLAAHGYVVKSDVEQLASGIVFMAVLLWSVKSKKPRKIKVVNK